MKLTAVRTVGLAASVIIVGVAIVVLRPTGSAGYVQINTMPIAPVTQAVLYLGSVKLDPIHQGSALLRQRVGTFTLEADSLSGARTPLCDIVVRKNRITTITVSILERPPRCVCKFTPGVTASSHTCVS